MAAMGSIFLAYHRTDDPDTVQIIGHISDRLARHFGAGAILDGNTIVQPGMNLAQTIEALMPRQSVLLVPIGPRWLDPTASPSGRPLDNPYDPVRLQIEAAQRHRIPTIPLLVGRGTTLPAPATVPPSLAPILGFPSMIVREEPDFSADVQALTTTLGRWVRPRPVTTPTTGSRSARFYGLLYGFILFPADAIVLGIALLVASALSSAQAGGSANIASQTLLSWVTLAVMFGVLPLLAFFLAGWFAARRTGLARTGTFAGLIAACVSGGAGAVGAAGLLILVALDYKTNLSINAGIGQGIGLALAVLAVILGLAWLLANLGLGAAFGAIGGAFGRRAYNGLAAPQPSPMLATPADTR